MAVGREPEGDSIRLLEEVEAVEGSRNVKEFGMGCEAFEACWCQPQKVRWWLLGWMLAALHVKMDGIDLGGFWSDRVEKSESRRCRMACFHGLDAEELGRDWYFE